MTPDIKQLLDQQISRVANEVNGTVGADKILLTSISAKNNADYVKVTSLDPAVSNYHSYTDTTDDLPDALDVGDGVVIFVNDLKVPVLSVNGRWVTLNQPGGESVVISGPARPEYQLWAWGDNYAGRVGDGTTIYRSSPVQVVNGFTDWCAVDSGTSSTLAIRKTGTLWAWGENFIGELGTGDRINSCSPVQVIGNFTDWCQVSAGDTITAAIRQNGTLWTWGSNFCGGLGDGTTICRSSPVEVLGGFTDWCQVEVARWCGAAVRTNGTLWVWGINTVGQLGDGTIINKSSPVQVLGGFTDWCQVSVCGVIAAVRCNGTLWAWGNNNWGEVGDGTTIHRSSPVEVLGGFTDWRQVSVGTDRVAAVRSNGTLWAWGANSCGYNSAGLLGDGSYENKSSPVEVQGGFTDWCFVSAQTSGFVALRTNGTLWGWGMNQCGELGNNTDYTQFSPVQEAGGFTDWIKVSSGWFHTTGIRAVTP